MSQHLLDIILLVFAAGYAVEILFLRIGIARASRTTRRQDGYTPTVSIIVAARNEEDCIAGCLRSLAQVDYPHEKLEIIAVNDHSTDRTAAVIADTIADAGFMKTISTGHENGNLRGKTNAVAAGIEASSGELLLFTDADCRVQTSWVRDTVSYFTEDTGIVGGFTMLDSRGSFQGMQSLDWIVLFGTASAAAGWHIPLTAIGNNLSVRRSAYDQTGGFKQIPFSVTEDYALVQAILTRTKYTIKFPLRFETLVKSNPCMSWYQLFRQKQRWGVGGLDMVPAGFLMMSVGWAFKLALVVGVFFASPSILLGTFAAKSLIDIAFLWGPLKEMRSLSYLKYFPAFELYYTLYVITMPLIALFSKKVVWKERSL